ncbi:MAG: hypothetical protein IT372_37595 [Polyangiaceae bacterium]|nr:hypothetical protein [Polyangiaceae bacterium]
MTWKVLSAVLAAGVMLAGCGDDTGGGGGAGGQGGSTTSTTTTGTGGGGGGQGGQGGASGNECGGIGGIPCAADEYCDYGDNSCGADDGLGVCKPRPQGCPDVYMPACGCDGTVYGNECDANGAGSDISAYGGCTPPAGTFACGYTFCATGQQYCQRSVSDVGGEPDIYMCMDLPAGCGDCACLASEPCGSMCEQLPSGGFLVTCPGG